ncbi:cobyric acid synthase [Paucibacter sp. B2R-40]|uniref:cobyric acid synthase n=1 Tax=Paucibacter sp. B2R-40 TaxID=2893554 RepID=UPI0021E4872E|nr:cobyric acid synthase [Paucibacter sp. B2R-40]MCV2354657.1 cobyric acid synthase [Paucibacter sp. B2R-40]
MTAKAVMVLGTTSGAGKSWLATALCRYYARRGLKVAPYKAQNMSNNARVVMSPSPAGTQAAPRGGAAELGSGPALRPGLYGTMGEIGSAQYFQALAARRIPEVRMNPVLLKPEKDTASQVIVLGEVDSELTDMPWRERSEKLWLRARPPLHELLAENDVVVIEGAGSPAEINLHSSDYVNMRTALEAKAACLLVTDIDRGGAFAHLFGTHQLLPAHERALIKGYVLNRFRGDASLLAPGPEQLQALTGVPTVAVLPMWRGHGLPEEDGVFDDSVSGSGLKIAIVAYPRMSNLDEFQPLRSLADVRLSWARSPAQLEVADWIILPGSKAVAADLAWLRAQKLDLVIARHAAAGKPLLGICGGLQMLGESLLDPHGLDGNAPGLGLLPLVTQFEKDKLLKPCSLRFEALTEPWSALAGIETEGYEIHHGRTVQHPAMAAARVAVRNELGEAIGWSHGSVLGCYAHGLFEQTRVMQALFGAEQPGLDAVFEGLADFIEAHFEPGVLMGLLQQDGAQ